MLKNRHGRPASGFSAGSAVGFSAGELSSETSSEWAFCELSIDTSASKEKHSGAPCVHGHFLPIIRTLESSRRPWEEAWCHRRESFPPSGHRKRQLR